MVLIINYEIQVHISLVTPVTTRTDVHSLAALHNEGYVQISN
jgi:hypothetical protein